MESDYEDGTDTNETLDTATIKRQRQEREVKDEKSKENAKNMLKLGESAIHTRQVLAKIILAIICALVFVYSYCVYMYNSLTEEIPVPFMWAIMIVPIVDMLTTTLDRSKYSSPKYYIYQGIRGVVLAISIGVYGIFSVIVLTTLIANGSVVTGNIALFRTASICLFVSFFLLLVVGIIYWNIHVHINRLQVPHYLTKVMERDAADIEQGVNQAPMNAKAHAMDSYAPAIIAHSGDMYESLIARVPHEVKNAAMQIKQHIDFASKAHMVPAQQYQQMQYQQLPFQQQHYMGQHMAKRH